MRSDQRGLSPLVILVVILALAAVGFGFMTYWQSVVATKQAASLKQALDEAEAHGKAVADELASTKATLAEKEAAAVEAEKHAAEITWKLYGAALDTLRFGYPSNFYVTGGMDGADLSVQSFPGKLILSGGVGCEEGDACSVSGMGIEITKLAKATSIPGNVTSTSYEHVLKEDLTDECKDADGVCHVPRARYYFKGKRYYMITIEASDDFSGDREAVTNGFLGTLKED